MEHPFIDTTSLEEKSMEELQESITELNKKLTFSYRIGNQALIHQLLMALESHQVVYRKKMDKVFEKQKLNTKIDIQKDGN